MGGLKRLTYAQLCQDSFDLSYYDGFIDCESCNSFLLESSSSSDFNSSNNFKNISQAMNFSSTQFLLQKNNVESVFVSTKIIDGVDSHQECIAVGVSKKVGKSLLKKEDLIPSSIEGFKTDVVEVPKMFAFGACGEKVNGLSPSKKSIHGCPQNSYDSDKKPYKCIPGGVSIGVANDYSAGTLGFSALNKDQELVCVTNNHVIGSQVYDPKTEPPISYNVSYENGFIFEDISGDSFKNPAFDNSDFAFIEAGRKYIFKGLNLDSSPFCLTYSDLSNLTSIYSKVETNVSIFKNDGTLIYKNGKSKNNSFRFYPILMSDEYMEFSYQTSDETFKKIYYTSWSSKPSNQPLNVLFFGVPFCCSTDERGNGDSEYHSGTLSDSHKNLLDLEISSPSFLDQNTVFGAGSVNIGSTNYIEPLFFPHPFNKTSYGNHGFQPINTVDAASINFGPSVFPSSSIIDLTNNTPSFSDAKVGDFVFKSGRTTGSTTENSFTEHPSIISDSWMGYVYYCSNRILDPSTGSIKVVPSMQHKAILTDCLYYRGKGENIYFSDSGDSGSLLMKKDGDSLKGCGLHFAGFNDGVYSHGLANKIGNVFNSLDLTVWNGGLNILYGTPEHEEYSKNGFIDICGKTYK